MADKFNILDHLSAPALRTGQTTSYTPVGRSTKDDGGFQRGVTGSKLDPAYEILTTENFSGTTNITVNGKTDAHSNECVYDKNKTLMWSRTVSAAVFGTGTEHLFWSDTTNNEDIFEYCDQANSANLAGFKDWRIPNILELTSLAEYEAPTADPNINAFPVWTGLFVWSSTTRPVSTSQALALIYNSGSVAGQTKTTLRLPTALVRLGDIET